MRLRRRTIWVDKGKKRSETVKVGQGAVQLLKRMIGAREDEPVVEGETEKQRAQRISTVFKRWQKSLEEPRLHCHAMRHSYAMALRAKGCDIYEVCRRMRHKSIEVTKVYFHDDFDDGVVDDLLDQDGVPNRLGTPS